MAKQTSAKIDGVKKFEMKCISEPKEIALVEKFLNRVNKTAKLDDGTFYRLLVASTEAVNNAILHGNKSDTRKHVCLVVLYRKNDSIVVRVKDEGKGFDPNSLPNPLDEKHLLKPSGRGVFLMRELMDEVNFSFGKDGSTVELVINLKRLK